MNDWVVLGVPMVGYAFATSASPGPVNIVALMAGLNYGIRRNLLYVAGATFGFVFLLFLAGLGLGATIKESIWLRSLIAVAGGSYMLYLGIKLANARVEVDFGRNVERPPRLIDGVLAQWLNPKAWVVSVFGATVYLEAALPYYIVLLTFCVIFFVVCFLSLSMWVYAGAYAAHAIKSTRTLNVFTKFLAGILCLSVAYLLWSELSLHFQ